MQFTPSSNYGFHVTLANGVVVSVQYGYGNYCENRDNRAADKHARNPDGTPDISKFTGEYVTAEIAVWDDINNWFQVSEYDQVLGWQTPAEVQAAIFHYGSLELTASHYWSHWGRLMQMTRVAHEQRREASESYEKTADSIVESLHDIASSLDSMRTGVTYPDGDAHEAVIRGAVEKLSALITKRDGEWRDPLQNLISTSRDISWKESQIEQHSTQATRNAVRAREVGGE